MEQTLDTIYQLPLQNFFAFLKTIRYGYKDQEGKLHFAGDDDFRKAPYGFSEPWEVVNNRCGWCWDVCQLIKYYCVHNGYPYKTWYFEYSDPEREIHITHTQCFLKREEEWYVCPDNSDPSEFGVLHNPCFEDMIDGMKASYGKNVEAYYKTFCPECYLVKEYDLDFASNLSDGDLMEQIRTF